MPEVVFDTCALSNFALSDSLHLIQAIYRTNGACVTDFVASEITKGILKGHGRLIGIRKALGDGWIREIALTGTEEKALFESLSVSLGAGEASSIAAAKTRGFVFACDDRAARREAAFLGVRLTGTLGILAKAVKGNLLTLKEADRVLRLMIDYGFHSPVGSISEIM